MIRRSEHSRPDLPRWLGRGSGPRCPGRVSAQAPAPAGNRRSRSVRSMTRTDAEERASAAGRAYDDRSRQALARLVDQPLGRPDLAEDAQQLLDVERLEHDADPQPVQLLSHRLI